MTRGEILINLYEIGRELKFQHLDAFRLAEQAFNKMHGELDTLWYLVYLECRATYTQEISRNIADTYAAKVEKLLDELS